MQKNINNSKTCKGCGIVLHDKMEKYTCPICGTSYCRDCVNENTQEINGERYCIFNGCAEKALKGL